MSANRFSNNTRPLSISADEIHLWCIDDETIKDEYLLNAYHNLLNEAESIQQKRFHFDKHRHQYLVARALVRSVLSRYSADIAPKEWVFEKNQYGKPFITKVQLKLPLKFNLSHTDNMILLAVSLGNEVGVDVEPLSRNTHVLELASNIFTPDEYQQLLNLPDEHQKDRFFDLWTLKEAYIKACGMGLSIPLNEFTYDFPQEGRINITFDPRRKDDPEQWHLWCLEANNTHKISLAIKNSDLNAKYTISLQEVTPLSQIKTVDFSIAKKSKQYE